MGASCRSPKDAYDATRGGERNSHTPVQRDQAKRHFEICKREVDAGLAAEKNARKGKKPVEVSQPAAQASGSGAAVEHADVHAQRDVGQENRAGVGTRYQAFPVFRGPDTSPFLDY